MRLSRSSQHLVLLPFAALAALFIPACTGEGGNNPAGNQAESAYNATGAADSNATAVNAVPFMAVAPRAYVAKVKNVLTGLSATDAEVSQVMASPAALKSLIAQWQSGPTYQPKMLTFLSNAFQQSEVIATDFADQGVKIDTRTIGTNPSNMLLQNLQESFARTVLYMDAANQPFNTVMSTQTFMLTPPLATYYAYLDATSYSDTDKMANNNANTLTAALANFVAADYANWRPVTIRQPKAGEATTQATDTATVTSGDTLILNTPRQGFFTTPAFFAGWQTNTGNQARVTINQTLITALNHAFDGGLSIAPPSLAAVDAEHAPPTSSCYACHIDLDPMRQFFRNTYTVHYSVQKDPNEKAILGMFAFDGVSMTSTDGIYDLGTQLASHPLLASAWVEKVCTYATDAYCDPTDPEFVRIVALFKSNYAFNAMVQEVFASPLVTYASATQSTTQNGENFAVTKRDHLCPLLSNRLGITDVCGLLPTTTVPAALKTAKIIAGVLPANGYSRGAVLPVLANDPTLFYRSGVENICAAIAGMLVNASGSDYMSSDPNTAIANVAHQLMGLTAADDATPLALLHAHYDAALKTGAAAGDALKSTFVAGCLSPAVVGIGQ